MKILYRIFTSTSIYFLFQSINKERILQTCTVNNCELCQYSKCTKCVEGRVLPDCICPLGYYSDSLENCVKCSANCKTCDNNGCTKCFKPYLLQNSVCVCNIPSDGDTCGQMQSLYYRTEVGDDVRSVAIIFNRIIAIKNAQNPFLQTQENCKILSATSQLDYGVNLDPIQYGGCYIQESQQNRFIVVLTNTFNAPQLLNPPTLQITEILVYNGPALLSAISATQEEDTGDLISLQLNKIPKICYFQQPSVKVKENQVGPFPIYTPYLFKNVLSSNTINCSDFNQNTYTCDDNNGLTLSSQYASGVSLTIQVKCTGLFGYQTTDQIVIQFIALNQIEDNILITSTFQQQQLYFKQSFTTMFSVSHLDQTKTGLIITIDTYPSNILNSISINENSSFTSSVQYQIPSYKVNTDNYVNIMITASSLDQSIQAFQFYQINYQSIFSLSIKEQGITNYIPSNLLTLTSQIVDNDVQIVDMNLFNINWYCFNVTNQPTNPTPCIDKMGQTLVFENSYNLKLQNQLTLNCVFIFSALVKRKSNSFNQKIAWTQVESGQSTVLLISDKTKLQQVNFQDILFVELSYTTTLHSNIESCYYGIKLKDQLTSGTAQYSSLSNKISFILEDIFPDLDLSQLRQFIVNFFVIDNLLQSTIISAEEVTMSVRSPPFGCVLLISTQIVIGFQDKITISATNCQTNSQVFNYQFFYYNSLVKRKEEIESSGKIMNRRMISINSQNTVINTLLPPGELIIMVTLRGPNDVRTNFTQATVISNNDFNQNTYEQFILDQHSSAQQKVVKSDEILLYQIIIEAIEQYETKYTSYTPSSNIQSTKNTLLQRLYDKLWSSEANEIYQLSLELINRIKNTKIQITSSTLSTLISQNEQTLASINQSITAIGSSLLTQSQRQYYQQIIGATIQDFMKNNNNLNQWTSSNNENAILQSSNAMDSISQTMITNQSPIVVQTQGAQLFIQKLDYSSFMSLYYQDTTTQPTSDEKNMNYYVQIQTWPETHPLYRDELQQINQQYISEATQEQKNMIKKTYPIKIPSIQTEKLARRRLLAKQAANLKSPLKVIFEDLSETEKLVCIQRQKQGKWISNSCTSKAEIVGGKKQISCSCNTPDVTSIIADVADLFNNENVKDIFSQDGFLRIFELDNWYEYAPIWTMIGLNIVFIIIVYIGYRFDKRDDSNDLKKAFLYSKNSYQRKPKENLFMQIKNKKTRINAQKKNTKEQEQKIESEIYNTDNNKLIDQSPKIDFDAMQQQQQQQDMQQIFERSLNDQSKQQDKIKSQNSLKVLDNKDQQQSGSINENNDEIRYQDNKETVGNNLGYFEPSPQPFNKQEHLFLIEDSIKLQDLNTNLEGNQLQDGQQNNFQQFKQETNTLNVQNNQQVNQNSIQIKQKQDQILDHDKVEQTNSALTNDKEEAKTRAKLQQRQKFIIAKDKLEEYLTLEKQFKGVLVFHIFFSTFIVYNRRFSRVVRLIIYYNKMIWLLTLNSVFGKNLSVVQVIVLSIVTTVVLLLVTTALTALFKIKKFRIVGLVITSLFLLFCYYSILVAISGTEPYEANLWIGSYFATLILNEYIIGLAVCLLMYFICKKAINKIQNPIILEILGTGLLLQAFQT